MKGIETDIEVSPESKNKKRNYGRNWYWNMFEKDQQKQGL